MQHDLVKLNSGYRCNLCQQEWRGKPRGECVGVPIVQSVPRDTCTMRDLAPQNLKPVDPPVACMKIGNRLEYFYPKGCKTEIADPDLPPIVTFYHRPDELKTVNELKPLNRRSGNAPVQAVMWINDQWLELYRVEDCEIANRVLPQIYAWGNRPDHLKTENQLRQYNLRAGDATPQGCCWHATKQHWIFLYDPNDPGCTILDPTLPTCYAKESIPEGLKDKTQLKLLNLTPDKNAKPAGCYRVWEQYSSYEWGLATINLYRVEACRIEDETLPPCYKKSNYPAHLKTERELQDLSLVPGGATPQGCYRVERNGIFTTVLLYDPEDCQWQAQDNFICRSTLKRTYLLSDGWINRLGEPDMVADNPHHERWSSMKLYSRQRVETFLATHAEEYAEWLSERDRYIEIFNRNRAAIEAGRAKVKEQKQAIREQTYRCLRCASGCTTQQGFLCAIHPMGLEPHQIPCPDWSDRYA